MSQYLSLTAFAHAIGCPLSAVAQLIADERIKAYQFGAGEPFLRRAELAIAKGIISQGRPLTDNEKNVIQAEKDQVSRAESRAKIAAERKEEDLRLEKRRSKLAQRNTLNKGS